jgi:hypothetical protein
MDRAGPTTPYPAGRQAPPSGPGVTPGGRGWGASTSVKSASPVADGDPLVSSNPALDCKAHYADPLAGGVGMGRVADEVATTCAAQKGSRTVGRTSPSAPSVGGDSALKRESTIRRWQGGQGTRAASRRTRSRAAGAGRQRRCDDLRCPEGEPDRRADVAIGALSRRRLGAQAGINDSTLAGRPMGAGRQPAHPEACGPEPEGSRSRNRAIRVGVAFARPYSPHYSMTRYALDTGDGGHTTTITSR